MRAIASQLENEELLPWADQAVPGSPDLCDVACRFSMLGVEVMNLIDVDDLDCIVSSRNLRLQDDNRLPDNLINLRECDGKYS